MKRRKLSDKDLERHEAKRDIWREVLDGIDEIKAGGGKRVVVAPKAERNYCLTQGNHRI